MKRVLIIHGRADVRTHLAELLTREGYEVAQAANGREGLREANRRRPSLILLGLMMPEMDGRTFRSAQKKNELLANVPVIVISAIAADRWARLDGVAANFPNPFDDAVLLEEVKHFALAS